MTRPFARAKRPVQISTMPRQATEAAAHLEIYKLLVEKQRLQQELEVLDQRRQQILDRLLVLNQLGLEPTSTSASRGVAHALHQTGKKVAPSGHSTSRDDQTEHDFHTLFLEY